MSLAVILVAWLVLPAVASWIVGIEWLRRLSRLQRRSPPEIAGAS